MTNEIERADLDFSSALRYVKLGKKIARLGWNGKGLTVQLQVPDKGSKMTLPYLYIEYPEASAERGNPIYPEGSRCPWLASQTDILATDWLVVA